MRFSTIPGISSAEAPEALQLPIANTHQLTCITKSRSSGIVLASSADGTVYIVRCVLNSVKFPYILNVLF